MKYYLNIVFRVIAFVCALSQIFISTPISSLAVSNDNTEDSNSIIDGSNNNTDVPLNNPAEISPSELTYTISNPVGLDLPNAIRIAFDATDVIDYSFEAEGLIATEDQTTPMVFDLIANEEFGKFEIDVQKVDGEILNKTIYTYSNHTDVFVSEISKDDAWHNCKNLEYNSNIITIEEWHEQYSALSLLFSEPETNYSFENTPEINDAVLEGKVVVRGKMTWKTEAGTTLPLRYAKVELRYQYLVDSLYIAASYTDSNGYYCFIFDPDDFNTWPNSELNLFVRTYIESETFTVLQPYFYQFNYFDSHVVKNVTSESGIVNISRIIFKNSDYLPYRLLYIQQGMVVGQRFALEMGMETDEKLYVFYLGNTQAIPDLNTIAMCYDTVSLIGHSHYNDFFATIHEYGHYVGNRMGNYGSALKEHWHEYIPDDFSLTVEYIEDLITGIAAVPDALSDFKHTLSGNHFEKNTSRNFQMELVWTESWATAFAEITMQYYCSEYLGAYNFTSASYENYTHNNKGGEAQEVAVISFLWDLYDSYSSFEANDNVNLTAQKWWNITTQPGTYTLQDLSNTILNDYPELINGVGEILSEHQIAPFINPLTSSPCIEKQLKLKWMVNGSQAHPNNIFHVAFYDNENTLLCSINDIRCSKAYNEIFNYDVQTDIWKTLMDHYEAGKTIYAVVYGHYAEDSNNDGIEDFRSGPYFSKYITVWDDSESHIYSDNNFDDTNHWGVCNCGVEDTVKHEHELSISNTDSTSEKHILLCDECEYYTYEIHNYVEFIKTSESGHTAICECGYEAENRSHFAFRYTHSIRDLSTHNVYCACGHFIGKDFHQYIGIGDTRRCIHCGYEKQGGLEIMGKKEEDEVN